MTPPKKLTKGPKKAVAAYNALLDYCKSIRLVASETCAVHETDNGIQALPVFPDTITAAITASLKPFQLVAFKDGSTQKVKVKYSTLAGVAPTTPTPNGDGDYVFTPSGTQIVYAKLTIDGSTGPVTGREIAAASSLPTDDDTHFYVQIGTMTDNGSDPATVSNARYGPITGTVCRNWFAAASPYFGVTFG